MSNASRPRRNSFLDVHHQETMDDYLYQVKEISDHPSIIGETMTDKDLSICVIRELDSRNNSFISSLSFYGEYISFDDVHNMLLCHEGMLD